MASLKAGDLPAEQSADHHHFRDHITREPFERLADRDMSRGRVGKGGQQVRDPTGTHSRLRDSIVDRRPKASVSIERRDDGPGEREVWRPVRQVTVHARENRIPLPGSKAV